LPKANAPAQLGPGFRVISGPAYEPRSLVATIMTVAGQALFAFTDEAGVGKLQSSYAVPIPVSVSNATIDVVQVDEVGSRADNYGSYSVDLGSFHGDVGQDSIVGAFAPTVLLDVDRQPDPALSPDAPDIARNGYHLQVTGQQLDDKEVVAITLNVDRGVILAIGDYQIAAHLKTGTITAPLNSSDPGLISGQIVLPVSMHAGSVQIEVTGIPEIAPSLGRTSVAGFTVVLPPPHGHWIGTKAVDAVVDPNPDGLTGLQRTGFRATVIYTAAQHRLALEVVITIDATHGPIG
jgi:hypothetical protein